MFAAAPRRPCTHDLQLSVRPTALPDTPASRQLRGCVVREPRTSVHCLTTVAVGKIYLEPGSLTLGLTDHSAGGGVTYFQFPFQLGLSFTSPDLVFFYSQPKMNTCFPPVTLSFDLYDLDIRT